MKPLTLLPAAGQTSLAHPEHVKNITLDDPALAIFTDFRQSQALVVQAGASAAEAESRMREAHVRMKIVVDKANNVLGMVSLDDLNNQEMIKRISQGFHRSELKVSDFMRPLAALKAFRWQDIQQASIGDVVDALQANGEQHCLAVDNQRREIRGIISASDIARKLRLPVDIATESNFARLSHVIYQQIKPRNSLAIVG